MVFPLVLVALDGGASVQRETGAVRSNTSCKYLSSPELTRKRKVESEAKQLRQVFN